MIDIIIIMLLSCDSSVVSVGAMRGVRYFVIPCVHQASNIQQQEPANRQPTITLQKQQLRREPDGLVCVREMFSSYFFPTTNLHIIES